MQLYRIDKTFSVLVFIGNIYSGKLYVFKVLAVINFQSLSTLETVNPMFQAR